MTKQHREQFRELLTTAIKYEVVLLVQRTFATHYSRIKAAIGIVEYGKKKSTFAHNLNVPIYAFDPYIVLTQNRVMLNLAEKCFGNYVSIPQANVKAFAQSYFCYTNSIILKIRKDGESDCIYVSQGGSYYTYYIDANNGKLMATESDEVPDIYSENCAYRGYTFNTNNIERGYGSISGMNHIISNMKQTLQAPQGVAIELIINVLENGENAQNVMVSLDTEQLVQRN